MRRKAGRRSTKLKGTAKPAKTTDEPRETEKASISIQCFVVIDPSLEFSNEQVEVVKKFVAEVPKTCKEALAARKSGSFQYRHEFPGIPKKKYNKSNMDRATCKKNKTKLWSIQAIIGDGRSGKLFILYEGWTSDFLEETTRKMLPKSVFVEYDICQKFLDALRKRSTVDSFIKPKLERDPEAPFWYFEDLTYFHSTINKQQGLAPIFYMNMCKPGPGQSMIMPPNYAYTARNLVPRSIYDFFIQRISNLNYDRLKRKKRLSYSGPKNVCSGRSCVCDKIFHGLYAGKCQSLNFKSNGTLDFSQFETDVSRVLVECSDRCGCDENCPRRALQRGQQKPLVVNYEQGIGFGLRTAELVFAGELICEYTGEMMLIDSSSDDNPEPTENRRNPRRTCRNNVTPPIVVKKPSKRNQGNSGGSSQTSPSDQDKDEHTTTYDVGLSVMAPTVTISALKAGNIARFINHSCAPNAVFVECHSRRSEEDPLIPRVAVFALEDIPLGGEITIAYWSKDAMKNAKLSDIKCKCGDKDCIGFLPESI